MRRLLTMLLLMVAGAAPARAQQKPAADTSRMGPAAAPAERIGGAQAPVVIEEYADFQCPSCRMHDTQYSETVEAWVRAQKGKVRLDFYDVALRQHPTAPAAAHAARCAGEQHRYAAARHALFASQPDWAGAFNAQERVTAIARGTVPDTAAFDRCMEADPTALYATLGANLQRGRELGIPGTPTFVIRIGGRRAQVVDPVPADSLAKAVKALEAGH